MNLCTVVSYFPHGTYPYQKPNSGQSEAQSVKMSLFHPLLNDKSLNLFYSLICMPLINILITTFNKAVLHKKISNLSSFPNANNVLFQLMLSDANVPMCACGC